MSTFTELGPGLLFVQSKIRSPDLTDKVFNEWYNDEHLRDILASKGFKSANRYKSCNANETRYPYLALYPAEEVEFLQSDQFRAIPTQSKRFPNGGSVYDFADFEVRFAKHVETIGKKHGSPEYVVTAVFELDQGANHAESLAAIEQLQLQGMTSRTSLWRSFFGGPTATGSGSTTFIALLESDNMIDISGVQSLLRDSQVNQYKLIKSVGEEVKYFCMR